MSMSSENPPVVLIVKDDKQVLDLIVDVLEPQGYKMFAVESARRALELTKTLRADIILCDVIMPEMNGLELCHRLKSDSQTAKIPVMLVSAVRKEEAARLEGYSAGADDYLEIPFRNEELLIKVARLIERQRSETALRESEHRYREIFDNANDLIYTHDLKGSFTSLNRTGEELTGYSIAEALAMNFGQVIVPEQVELARRMLERKLHNDDNATVYEVDILSKAGRRITLELSTRLIYRDGQPVGVQGIGRDVTERKRAEAELRESEERSRAVLGSSLDAIVTMDDEGKIVEFNPAAEKTFGYRAADALGKPLADLIIPPSFRAAHQRGLENYLKTGAGAVLGKRLELNAMRADGTEFAAEVAITRITKKGAPLFTGFIRDISERKRAEAELLRRNQELAALNEISHELSKLREPTEIAHLIHAMIGKVIDNRNLYVAFYDERKNEVSFPAYTINGQPYHAPTRKFDRGLTEHVIRTKQPLYIERDLDDTLRKLGLKLSGRSAECWLAVPMLVGEKVVGVITIQDYDKAEAYDQGHLELLRTIASHAAIVVENARLYQIAEASSAREALVNRLGQAIRSSLSMPEVQETTVRELGTALSASRVQVRLCDGNDEDLFVKTEFAADGKESAQEFDNYYDRLLRDHFRNSTSPLVIANVQQLAADGSPIAAGIAYHAKEESLCSTLVSPVTVENRFRGVICVEQTDAVRHWTEDEVLLVEAVAAQLANGIAQAELFHIVTRAKNEWETTFDAMSDGVFIFDPSGRLIRVNTAGAGMDNTAPQAILGRKCCEILRADSDEVECIVERSLREARSVNLEIVPYKLKRPVLVTVEPVFDGTHEVVGAVCTARDLSELRMVEAVARERQSMLKNILESANEAIYALDREGRYQWCNQAMLALTGREMDELIGTYFLDQIHEDDREMQQMRFAQVFSGEPQRFESRYVAPDGAIRHAAVNSAPIVVDGETTGALGIAHDVTEQRQERERAARADKLRALGQLASGVAHDFNNSLAAILGRAQLILRRVHDDELIRSLGVIVTAAEDAAATVRRIQTFARKSSVADIELVDVSNLMRDAVEITRTRWQNEARAAGRSVEVVLNLDGEFLTRGNASELREVFVNLIVNAVDAMPNGGTLTLCCKGKGERLQLRFADTGVGMEEEVRERIFEPFYTTKGVHGTGLGLAVSYGIIERHLGTISVSSKPGEGTVFHIELPVHQAIAHRAEEARAKPDTLPSLSVLVVDDEAVVRETLAEILVELDHKVVTADCGRDALNKVATDDFDLVFTDLAMPEMDGWETAREIRKQKPDLPVVLVTGYGATAQPPSGEVDLVADIIGKPFDFSQVTGAIARVCAQ